MNSVYDYSIEVSDCVFVFCKVVDIPVPYSGKYWRALSLVKQLSKPIGEFKFGVCKCPRIAYPCA